MPQIPLCRLTLSLDRNMGWSPGKIGGSLDLRTLFSLLAVTQVEQLDFTSVRSIPEPKPTVQCLSVKGLHLSGTYTLTAPVCSSTTAKLKLNLYFPSASSRASSLFAVLSCHLQSSSLHVPFSHSATSRWQRNPPQEPPLGPQDSERTQSRPHGSPRCHAAMVPVSRTLRTTCRPSHDDSSQDPHLPRRGRKERDEMDKVRREGRFRCRLLDALNEWACFAVNHQLWSFTHHCRCSSS